MTGHSADAAHAAAAPPPDLNRLAFQATIHCLTGCAIGEVLGLVISTALGWHDLPSIVLAIVLSFVFGYALTIRQLTGAGIPFRRAAATALAADTVSIAVMEIVDNADRGRGPGRHGGRPARPAVLGQPRPLAGGRVRRRAAREPLARGAGLGHAVMHDEMHAG